MSEKVDIWDSELLIIRDSLREYDQITVVAESESGFGERRMSPTILYIDAKNGLIVDDVEKYENWLTERNLL